MEVRRTLTLLVAGCGLAALAHPFSHKMPAETNESPLDLPYSEIAETFASPFGKVETGCYWYWLSGNISADGIDRAYIGDINDGGKNSGPVRIFSCQ